ncbi:MAG: 30S ribosomal protein S19 [Candidatus Methanomethylophilaceae archaeon]|jgi:small subunit ribosomal protein S19|nr:30S ribosomal protein S19 [Candidatus Methanomethylophilaceae archaeon]MBP5394297.1 30S ribosomal protein S19 [Candidatus Methanomethylophilaceae archaeon]
MARSKIIAGSAKASRRRSRKKASAIQARRKKEFLYRGNTMDELLAMSFEEVLELMPSRSRRTYLRGLNYEQQLLFDNLKAAQPGEVVRTHRRDLPIIPQFVGKTVSVYNGKEFKDVEIKPEMIGCFIGEFIMTRKAPQHSGPGVGATRSSKSVALK